MQSGKSYTVHLDGLTANETQKTILFSHENSRSDAIHVNQIGFTPTANQKYAYLYHYAGDLGGLDFGALENSDFHLIKADGSGQVVFTGKVAFRSPQMSESNQGDASYYGSPVWECNFSSYQAPGNYRISIPGVGFSYDFEIEPDVYREAFFTSVRGLYHQRSGAARGLPYSTYEKPEDHIPGLNGYQVLYSNFRIMDTDNQDTVFLQLPAQATTTVMPNAYGGWMDAADYDKYIEHLIIVNDLCLAYEFNPCHFIDNELNIPESGDGIPDILNEARFEVDFFWRLQGPTGGIGGGLETEDHPGPSTSWTDIYKTWYQFAEDPLSSYWFAASSAQLAYCFGIAGFPDLKADYLAKAESAYAWAQNNLTTTDLAKRNCFGRQMQAAAWLFKVTEKSQYLQLYEDQCPIQSANLPLSTTEGNFEHAVWAYITSTSMLRNPQLVQAQKQAAIAYADDLIVEPATNRACRMGFGRWFPNIVGLGSTTPNVLPAAVAYFITADQKYKDAIQTTSDYYLGGNPLNTVWVTGLGDNPVEHIAHLESWYDNKSGSVPGITPYGMVGANFLGGTGFWGSWAAGYNALSYYPSYWGFASHELFTENRYCWIANEFTIWQNIGPTATTYALLCADICTINSFSDKATIPSGFEALPNPFQYDFTLNMHGDIREHEVAVHIYDITGRIVEQNLFARPDLIGRLGTRLTSGIYTVVCTVGNEQLVAKVMKF
jgi:endoglucanase